MKTQTKLALATAAASLFAAAATQAQYSPDDAKDKKEGLVKCYGVNACKGKGVCGTEKHDCAGKNACKSQGVTKLTPKECEAKKGTVIK